MASPERVAARVFGEVAEDFDRVRSAYPAPAVDDVLSFGAAGDAARPVLDVGAGTGKATLLFAARGRPVVAVEPDDAMADVLERRAAGMPNVRVVRTPFERYRPVAPAGVLVSADAWHWTNPRTRWSHAAAALAPGGTLALCWNHERLADPVVREAMLAVLRDVAPDVVVRDRPVAPGEVWDRWPGDELRSRGEFRDGAVRVHRWRRMLSGADYLTLTATRSQFRMLPQPVRRRLSAALAQVLPAQVSLAMETELYLARRAED